MTNLQWVPLQHLQPHKGSKDLGEAEGDVGLLVGLRKPKLPALKPLLDATELAKVLNDISKDFAGL